MKQSVGVSAVKNDEFTQLDELRRALKTIDAQLSSANMTLNFLETKVAEAYYAACREFNEDGGMNKEAAAMLRGNKIPHSMCMPVPDKGYGIEGMGDLAATTMVGGGHDDINVWQRT